ncbi:MAG: hypothetical protein J3K34DRAFT_457838 [Monoraphidium minutum]|nr:MAG: hypothetical protein J3K34DRAFT_457838 [Monoraphidium minutum]
MARRALLWGVVAACLLSAVAVAAIDPGDITTCTNTNGTQVPKINSVKTCSSVSIISNSAKGFSLAFSTSKGGALVSAAGACGDAVSDGVGSICRGLDPGAAILGAAQICANALAAVYSRTAAGALSAPSIKDLLDPRSLVGLAPTKAGYYQACASSCNNAASAAEALAQGAACGATAAADGCAAVTAEVRSAAFARAFASVAADGWSKACGRGAGAALAGTDTMAASAAASFASAIAKVAVKACASCKSCKCSIFPSLPGVNAAGKWGDSVAAFAGGQVGLARSLQAASSALCVNGTKLTARAASAGTLVAVAEMVAGAVGGTKARAFKLGAATACSGSSVQVQLEAMKEASSKVISDASATVFGSWCPKAAAKLTNFEILTSDVIARAANKTAAACAADAPRGILAAFAPGAPHVVTQQAAVRELLMSHEPLKKKVAEALNEAMKCGCPPSLCLFCKPAASTDAISGPTQ